MSIDQEFIQYLEKFITPERNNRMNEILAQRTKYITVVLEDVFQSHNISAVLRSCDCFGINDIHLIENKNEFEYNKEIGLGSSNWLDIIRHNKTDNNTLQTINELRSNGYRIIATSPHSSGDYLEDLRLEKGPVAIFFGTEYTGLTDNVLENCDELLKIPLYGFTESLNISVSAAIILNSLYNKLIKSGITWQISDKEKEVIKLQWLKNSIKKSELLEKEFLRNQNDL